jgi:hypothetical protein
LEVNVTSLSTRIALALAVVTAGVLGATFVGAQVRVQRGYVSTVIGAAPQTVTVDAATTFVSTSSYARLACTGAETINTITGGSAGQVLIIEDTDTDCTLADDDDPTAANAIDLTGAATNDVGAVGKIITLVYNGTIWLQTAESDN